MMKIILVNTVCGQGSVGRITADLYEAVLRHGHMAWIAYGRGKAAEEIVSYKIGSRLDFYRHVCRNFFKGEAGFGSAARTKKFLAFLDQEKPDLLHLHNLHGFYLQTELLFDYIKKMQIPVVWTLHDCWAFTGHCAYYDKNGCGLWREGCPLCRYHMSAYPYALFRDNAAESYRRKRQAFTGVKNMTLVSPSVWLAEQIGHSFLREYPVEILPNGIDLTQFTPRQGVKEKTCFTVLGVANIWEERKGISFFEMLAERLPEKYRIRLIGLTPGQRRRLEKKFPAKRLLAQERTESLADLAKAYRDADVFVNPTLEDNLPTANLEALACGTPVVTFATGGSPETIGIERGALLEGNIWRSGCGVCVEKGNEALLLKAVQEICQNPPEAAVCRMRAEQFDKTRQYDLYIALYRRICEGL